MPAIRILHCGEQAMAIEFGSKIDPAIHARVRRLAGMLATAMPERIVEVVPACRSRRIDFEIMQAIWRSLDEGKVALRAVGREAPKQES